ncbi:MAG: hypothetical protein WDN24_03650 [Sphingomonas sp.]
MPIAPEARAAMIDALDLPANASSPHALEKGPQTLSIVPAAMSRRSQGARRPS